MTYKETDIMHENGKFWVLREKDKYCVCVSGITHAATDSAYEKNDDGLSIAIARCNGLANREKFGTWDKTKWVQL